MSEHTRCLILAAGFSRRFGSDKLLHRLPNGQRVIESTIHRYKTVCEHVSVVVRDGNVDLRLLLNDLGVACVINNEAEQGMSRSIVSGVKSTHPELGWLVGLADMPYVKSETLRAILSCAQKKTIVQPSFNGQRGNPVFFGERFRSKLTQLTGDVGARHLIQRVKPSLVELPCDDAGILQDIDTKQDLIDD